MKMSSALKYAFLYLLLSIGVLSTPFHVSAAPGDNCATDIVSSVPDNFDWSQVFIVRGADGSAWQRAVISNGGGTFQLDEMSPTDVYGTAAPYAPVQVFIFAPRKNATGGLRKPDQATCFEADTRWTTTESDIAVQIGSGFFSLPIASRTLWPSIGNDIVLDAFYKLNKPFDAVMNDTAYKGNLNFLIGTHLPPTTLKIAGTRDTAVCKEICDGGPGIGVELDPVALPEKFRNGNFGAASFKQILVGRMPGVHTFYAGFKDSSTNPITDKAAMRRIAQKAMGMEIFKRALLGDLNARGRPPGIGHLTSSRFEEAASGKLAVSVNTRLLIRYAAVLLIGGDNGGQQQLPFFEVPTRDSDFNIVRPEMASPTPTPVVGPILGATAKPTAKPLGSVSPVVPGGALPSIPANLPSIPTEPGALPQENAPLPGPPPSPLAPGATPTKIPLTLVPSENSIAQSNSGTANTPPAPPATPLPLASSSPSVSPPPTIPRIPAAPDMPPPGVNIFDGISAQTALQQLGTIIDRGHNNGLIRELFPEGASTEETWASDLITLIGFWTGGLKVNNCLLADDKFLEENFSDQIAGFSAVQCEKYPYVSGMTPLLLITREEELTLTPEFHEATIVSSDTLFDSGEAWHLPAGVKPELSYLYEFTAASPRQRIGEFCAKRSELPELITALEKSFTLSTEETNVLSRELHAITPNVDELISFKLADPADIAKRIIWNGNGDKLHLLQLFFDIDAGRCSEKSIPEVDLDGYADRDGIEVGIIQ